jgi:hypothetical protein
MARPLATHPHHPAARTHDRNQPRSLPDGEGKCSRVEGDKRTDTDQSGHQECRAEGMNSCTYFYALRRQHFGEEDRG